MADIVLYRDLVGVQRSSVQHRYEWVALFVGGARAGRGVCFLGGGVVYETRRKDPHPHVSLLDHLPHTTLSGTPGRPLPTLDDVNDRLLIAVLRRA